MGIKASCPNGHGIKVKDNLAGKKVLCPTCGAKFRIPKTRNAAADTGLPTAKLLDLAPAVVGTLPRAMPFGQEYGSMTAPTADTSAPIGSFPPAAGLFPAQPFPPAPAASPLPAEPMLAPALEEPALTYLHPAIAERPDLSWCIAFPGGEPTEPMPAATMQAWLDSRQAEGAEVVWRSDWPDWAAVRDVFPEYFH